MKQMIFIALLVSIAHIGCSQKESKTGNDKAGNPEITDYLSGKDYSTYEVATFAGGCFWCTEAAFEQIEGVKDVISGYSGGHVDHPTYRQVGGGRTGHAEAIQIYYDPVVIKFETLLDVFFVAHDPTQLNRQGPDVGQEYRSAVFYHTQSQKEQTETTIKKLNDSSAFKRPIVTEVNKYEEFWVAEAYHQDYYEAHPENSYVQNVSRPKVEKVKKVFKDILKKAYKEKG